MFGEKTLNQALFRTFAAGAVALALAPVSAFAAGGQGGDEAAGPARTIDLAYEIFVGGVTLGKVDMSARIQGSDYKVVSSLDTAGIVNKFWQSHITASSNGSLGANKIQPGVYDASSSHAGSAKIQQVTVKFDGNGAPQVVADPPYSGANPVADEQKKGALDPTSAVLQVATGLSATAKNPCGTSARVFDGRRRYDVNFTYRNNVDVKLDNGLYAGPALLCEIKYVQVAGYKQKILAEGAKLPQMFAWMVSVPSKTDPSLHYLVPVRLWANTDFGVAAAVVSKVRLDGAPLAADRRAELPKTVR